MEQETYKIMEYDRVREMLAGCASSLIGKERAQTMLPTSDFDDRGSAIHRRSAKRGYTAKVWAFLDYNCENGFNFKEDD